MKIYRLSEVLWIPPAFANYADTIRYIDNKLNAQYVAKEDLLAAKKHLLNIGKQNPQLNVDWEQAYNLSNKADWDKAVEDWLNRFNEIIASAVNQDVKNIYIRVRRSFNNTVDKINDTITTDQQANMYYETEFAPYGKSQLYYFCKNIAALTSIMDTHRILATKKDSGTDAESFICLTSSQTNHPTRRPNKWPCGVILDTQKLVSKIFGSEFKIIPNFDWKGQTNPYVASAGKLNATVFFVDESDNKLAKREASYFYIEFLNCGRIPLTTEMYEIWDDWFIRNGRDYDVGANTSMIKADDPIQFITFKDENGKRLVGRAPKLKDLPEKLQRYIFEESVFDEKESRITGVTRALDISGLVKGFIFNVACKPFIDANIPLGTSFTKACSMLGINREVSKALPFAQEQFQTFLVFIQKYIINSNYQVAYYEAPVPLKWSEN